MKKEKMKWGVIFALLLAVTCALPVMAGSLEPPPGDPGPTMHSLEDLYKMLQQMNYRSCAGFFYRFCDMNNGTVLDMDTGLIWLKNANCFGKQDWRTAEGYARSLAGGQCGLTDGSAAGDWRLPTVSEWEAFIEPTRFQNPALSNAAGDDQWSEGDAFTNVEYDFQSKYWSSTHTYVTDTVISGSFIKLYYGTIGSEWEGYENYAWPVRNGN